MRGLGLNGYNFGFVRIYETVGGSGGHREDFVLHQVLGRDAARNRRRYFYWGICRGGIRINQNLSAGYNEHRPPTKVNVTPARYVLFDGSLDYSLDLSSRSAFGLDLHPHGHQFGMVSLCIAFIKE